MYQKDFDQWNEVKKRVDTHDTTKLYFKEREIWWVSVGLNIGSESDGKNELFERPVLVVRKINRNQYYGLPLTSRDKTGVFFMEVQYGLSTGVVCLSQLRVFSSKRLLRKIGNIPKKEFISVRSRLIHFLSGGTL